MGKDDNKDTVVVHINLPRKIHNKLFRLLPKGYTLEKAVIDCIKVGMKVFEWKFLSFVPDKIDIRKYQMKLIVNNKEEII